MPERIDLGADGAVGAKKPPVRRFASGGLFCNFLFCPELSDFFAPVFQRLL